MDALRRDEDLVELLEEIKSKYDHLIESLEDEDQAQNFGKGFSNIFVHTYINISARSYMYMYTGRNIVDYQ